MGQQQLLLLVLSTVIVGLATVAGIQAFQENEEQATQDALVQRAINIGNDVLAAHEEPSQFGGVNLNTSSTKSDVATAAGYDSNTGISADGAGDNGACKISSLSSSNGTATIECSSDGTSGNYSANSDGTSNYQSVTVKVNANTDEVKTTFINSTSL